MQAEGTSWPSGESWKEKDMMLHFSCRVNNEGADLTATKL